MIIQKSYKEPTAIREESKRIHRNAKTVPPSVDGANRSEDIADVFANKYKLLYNSVPSDGEKMQQIRDHVNHDIQADMENTDYIVNPQEVKRAAQKLKSKKPDGQKALWSNHIKFGPEILFEHISELLSSMFSHGTTAHDLLVATITSLIKDKTGNYSDSNNYRGTALISAIAKIYDLIIIERYQEQLKTSELQFAFKKGHSTVMCHGLLKETVSYYLNRGSDIFCCMLDASKAFDRLRYDKLFELLRTRKFPPIIIRSLMDMYTRQKARTVWENSHSEYFDVTNGIRQGGIISPLLYTIYADELINRLEAEGIGCHIGHKYVGAPSYADDMTLVCPSVKGLQRMVDICAEYGMSYDVKYNEKKSVCIVFDRKREQKTVDIYLNGNKLECVQNVKHLGVYISNDMNNGYELIKKKGNFIGTANHVLSKYGKMSSDTISRMIDTYCCHFYGSETWDLKNSQFDSILTSWNISIRKAWKLPYRAHRYMLPILAGHNARDIVYKKFINYYVSMLNSDNDIIASVTKRAASDARSWINVNMQKISLDWNIDIDYMLSGLPVNCPSHTEFLTQDKIDAINMIVELNQCIHGMLHLPAFQYNELNDMYNHIAEN